MSALLKKTSRSHPVISESMQNNTMFKAAVFIIIGISLLLRLYCIGSYDLLVEEAYYWNYAQHLDFGYLDHPPMVALLIKITTSMFGTNEIGVRISSLFCWLFTAFFSFKLTELISRGAGLYAVMLLAILPFFFLQSLVITPDQPLIVCWSAALYCLYRALILNETRYWYGSGLWIGLGLLSKYSIVLLGPATLMFVCMTPTARPWLTRKEPYLAALIAAVFFIPVIYWNATHEWVSFVFQSTRRLHDTTVFSFHEFIALLIYFLMPIGFLGLCTLFKKNKSQVPLITVETRRFVQIFTLVPLIVFGVFSLSHQIKFNWIGPGLLAIIPWLAVLIKDSAQHNKPPVLIAWLITVIFLFMCYSGLLLTIIRGTPERANALFFSKYIDWSDLTQQILAIARDVEKKTNTVPIIIPLDKYNIASELGFYQETLYSHGDVRKKYTIEGRQHFGGPSLMYEYWSKEKNISGRTLILVSNEHLDFEGLIINHQIISKSPIEQLWSHSQGKGAEVTPFYYQIAEIKSPASR